MSNYADSCWCIMQRHMLLFPILEMTDLHDNFFFFTVVLHIFKNISRIRGFCALALSYKAPMLGCVCTEVGCFTA